MLNAFSKSRKSRKLSSKNSYLFDYDLNLENLNNNKVYGFSTDCNSDSHLNNIQKDNFNLNEKNINKGKDVSNDYIFNLNNIKKIMIILFYPQLQLMKIQIMIIILMK